MASTGLYRKRGIWLASVVVAGPLRDPELLAHVRQAPSPRLGALLDATRRAAVEYDDEDYWFVRPPSGNTAAPRPDPPPHRNLGPCARRSGPELTPPSV